MENILQIYKAINIKSIVYETGDVEATILCDLEFENRTVSSRLLVSLTDLNRMISKMSNYDSEWLEHNMESLYLEDGSQLIEYNFKNHTNAIIPDFYFKNTFSQIGA